MPKQEKEKPPRPKITIIPGRGVAQTINYLLEDRDELEWIIAVGRTKNGELFFYDTGGAFHNFGSGSLSQGAGIGIRWRSPIGPVRADIAWALSDPRHPIVFHLNIGPDL